MRASFSTTKRSSLGRMEVENENAHWKCSVRRFLEVFSCTRVSTERLNVEFSLVREVRQKREGNKKKLFSRANDAPSLTLSLAKNRGRLRGCLSPEMHRMNTLSFFSLSLSFSFSVCNSGNEHATYTSSIIPMRRMENTIVRAKDRERDKDRRVNRARQDFNRSFFLCVNLPFLLVFEY